MSKSTIGIDLGTTNTCAAYIKNQIPHIIPTFQNTPTIPSVLSLPTRTIINKNNINNDINNDINNKIKDISIFAVKRLIGQKYANIREYLKNLPYKTTAHTNGDVYIKYGKTHISPTEISAIILQHVKKYCEAHLKSKIKNCVITVPAYFDDTQRQATKDACRIAGMNVIRMINEPTAAALAYGLNPETEKKSNLRLESKLDSNSNQNLESKFYSDSNSDSKLESKLSSDSDLKSNQNLDSDIKSNQNLESDLTLNLKPNLTANSANSLFTTKFQNKIVAVYDLGGGTFDISILSLNDGIFEVLSTNGNSSLGGEDIDNHIRKCIIDRFTKEHKIFKNFDNNAMYRIKQSVENLKKDLSYNEKAVIHVPNIIKVNNQMLDLKYTFTRSELETMVKHIVEKTIEPCLIAMKDAKLTNKNINHVILVGGSTKMPLVRKMVENIFDKIPDTSNDPMTVVAKGAAIQAGIIEGEYNNIVLLDVNSLSLGIETVGGIFNKIIKRNTTLPTKVSQIFTTSEDNQTEVIIKIYQGERALVKHNKLLGEIVLQDIGPMKRGKPLIEVTFEGDTNGIYHITARDVLLNKEQKMEIQPVSGLSKDEIDKIIREANKEEEMDKKRIECAKIKNEIQRMMSDGIENKELMGFVENDVFDIEKAREMVSKILSTK